MDLLSNSYPDILGYMAAGAVFATFCMRTMLALRIVAIASNLAFIAYALAADLSPILVLHGALLPLNLLRLAQMQRAPARLDRAAAEAEGFGWLAGFGDSSRLAEGEVLFRKGQKVDAVYVVQEGEVEAVELGVTMGPGEMFGEIGLFSPQGLRTATVRAVTPARVSAITEPQIRRLHYNNPLFAYRLTSLIVERLLEETGRLDAEPVMSRRTSG